MKKKLQIRELRVKSFVTEIKSDKESIGGSGKLYENTRLQAIRSAVCFYGLLVGTSVTQPNPNELVRSGG